MKANILVLGGDGVGPEVTAQAVRALERIGTLFGHDFVFEERLIGGAAIDECGDPFPRETLAACRAADAILLGAVGGPKWDDPSAKVRPEQGLLRLRKDLQVFANLRPCTVFPELPNASPLRADLIDNVDFMCVRELTGGIYFGKRKERDEDGKAWDTMEYSAMEVERVVKVAAKIAQQRPRKKLLSVDKANVLACSRLWRSVAEKTVKQYAPDVTLSHMYIDAACMHLLRAPGDFDVVVTGNMFGDIITDEASMLPGSLGLLPSASIGESGPGVYEPIHGSAPDIAGRNIANPIGSILSAAMLLRHSLSLEQEAQVIEKAVRVALAKGARTGDIAKECDKRLTTVEMGDAIISCMTA